VDFIERYLGFTLVMAMERLRHFAASAGYCNYRDSDGLLQKTL
jgi:hypothetical protein